MNLDPRELLDVDHIAAYAKLAASHVAQRIVTQPDFPAPIRPLGPRSHPRWVAGEVMGWFEARKAA